MDGVVSEPGADEENERDGARIGVRVVGRYRSSRGGNCGTSGRRWAVNARPLLRILLWPLSVLYGAGVRARVWLYAHGWLKQKRLKAKVISVGNLTVGGTGQTPMVIGLAEKFLADGKRVAILSRGYRGINGTSDEIELMKSRLQNPALFGFAGDPFIHRHLLE